MSTAHSPHWTFPLIVAEIVTVIEWVAEAWTVSCTSTVAVIGLGLSLETIAYYKPSNYCTL